MFYKRAIGQDVESMLHTKSGASLGVTHGMAKLDCVCESAGGRPSFMANPTQIANKYASSESQTQG